MRKRYPAASDEQSISTLGEHNGEKTASDSRLKITNQLSLLSAVEQIRQQTATSTHRHLLLIEAIGVEFEDLAKVRCVIQQLYPDCLAVAGALTTDSADRPDQISRYLGTERQAVVFDATVGFDPGLLGAVASTVTAGGLLVLLTRTFDVWPVSFKGNTPGQTVIQPSTSPDHGEPSRFIERFIRLFESAHDQPDSMMSRLQLTLSEGASPEQGDKFNAQLIAQPSARTVVPALPEDSWKHEQEQLLTTLLSGVQTRDTRVFIVEAGRGRGKSSLLGRLAARLDACAVPWQLTSPRRSAVDCFERHWRQEAKHDAGRPQLRWLPTDQVPTHQATMHQITPAKELVLFVDEAADVPLPQLIAWTRQHSTRVLATTTTGYESSGRGFVTRFYESLSHSATSWKRFTLNHPVRFGQNDPLEAFLNRVLLLDATAQVPHIDLSDLDVHHLRTARLSQDELLEDENRLGSIFGLLREAHYQTTPMDLVNLLDAKGLRLYVITHAHAVLAVAMAAEEGQIQASLHEHIMSGKRRLKDQLLPQVLARMADFPEALGRRYLRIVRIAVAPHARRLGLGSHLLHQIESLTDNQFDAIGASYSQDDQTAAFWRQCGFRTFHEGFRAHPRSGHPTAAVLRIHEPANGHDTAREANLVTITRALDSACAILESNILATDPGVGTTAIKDADEQGLSERQLARRFSEGARSYHDTRAALLQLWIADPERQESATLDAMNMAVCRDLPSGSSRKKREAALRAWARNTLTHLTD